jgi:hypothetical protein
MEAPQPSTGPFLPTIESALSSFSLWPALVNLQLRKDTTRAAMDLLPEAIRQAKSRTEVSLRNSKRHTRPGSPARSSTAKTGTVLVRPW